MKEVVAVCRKVEPIALSIYKSGKTAGRQHEQKAESNAGKNHCGFYYIHSCHNQREIRRSGEFSGIWPKLIVFLVPYLIIGWDIIYKAGRGIINGQVFDENFLMTIATFGAFRVKGIFGSRCSDALFIRWANCSRITRLTAPDSLSAI